MYSYDRTACDWCDGFGISRHRVENEGLEQLLSQPSYDPCAVAYLSVIATCNQNGQLHTGTEHISFFLCFLRVLLQVFRGQPCSLPSRHQCSLSCISSSPLPRRRTNQDITRHRPATTLLETAAPAWDGRRFIWPVCSPLFPFSFPFAALGPVYIPPSISGE